MCTVIDVVDNVKMLLPGGGITQLTPATSVDITNGAAGTVNALSYEDLANNPLVAGNLYLDALAGKGLGGEDLPTTTTTTTLPRYTPPLTGQSTTIEIPSQNPQSSPSSVTTTLPEVPNVTTPSSGSVDVPGTQLPCVPSNKNPC